MTSPHDHVTTSPEYARSYQHYLSQGDTPEDAARHAYEWTAQQFAAAPPVAPPKRKGNSAVIALSVVGAVIAAVCIGGAIIAAMSGDGTKNSPGDTGSETIAGFGTPVRDGSFEFTVDKFECGVTVPTETPQGVFCAATVTVKNVKDKAAMFSSSSQKALGAGGVEYDADTVASLYMNQDGETFLNEINPGNGVTGVLVFDVPAAGSITMVELHDSPFSGGVKVRVV